METQPSKNLNLEKIDRGAIPIVKLGLQERNLCDF